MSNVTFVRVERYSENYPMPALVVGMSRQCGFDGEDHHFANVAAIIEPFQGNPCLILPRPLGFTAVKRILEEYAKLKNMEPANTEPAQGGAA